MSRRTTMPITLFAALCCSMASAKPLKIYILAGQSNMEGQARIETFDYIGEDPATASLLRAIRGPDGKIGPEFTFGLVTEKATDDPILIIKTAWGGKSLNTDFRSPSAGPYTLNALQKKRYAERNMDIEKWKADKALEKDAAYQQAKKECDKHVCNWGCHYRGSARAYCMVGFSMAEAMKPLLK